MMDSKRLGVLQGLSSGVLWGLYTVLIGLLSSSTLLSGFSDSITSPIVVATVGSVLSAVVATIYIILTGQSTKLVQVIFSKNIVLLLVSSLLAGPIATTAYTVATSVSGASVSASISALYPVLGLLICVGLNKDTMTRNKFIGVLIATVGTVVLGYLPGDTSVHVVGISLALVAALGWASESIVSSIVMTEVDPDVAIATRQILSMLLYVLAILPMIPESRDAYSAVSWILISQDLWTLLAIIGVTSTLSYVLWYRSINTLRVPTAMILNVSYTLWAIVFDVVVNKTVPSMTSLLGSLILTAGIMMVVSQDNL